MSDTSSTHEGPGSQHRWSARPRTEVVSSGSTRRNPLVGLLKFALVGLSILLIGILIIWAQVSERENGMPLDFADIKIGSQKSTMSNARFVSGGKHPLNIHATEVVQDATTPWLVHLKNPEGDTTLSDGGWMHLSALEGVFDREAQTLALKGDVSLYTDSANELHGGEAVFDLRTGRVTGGRPVTGHGPLGRIEAKSFEVVDNGNVVRFGGGVHLVVFPGARAGL